MRSDWTSPRASPAYRLGYPQGPRDRPHRRGGGSNLPQVQPSQTRQRRSDIVSVARERGGSLAPHRYRKPLRGGRLHSAVDDPNVEGANNGSNRLARRPQRPRPRPSEPPPAVAATARRQRQLLHHSGKQIELSASTVIVYPTLIPGPRIDASLLLPASMKGGPILIDIDVMQVFIPWEFRVAGMFER